MTKLNFEKLEDWVEDQTLVFNSHKNQGENKIKKSKLVKTSLLA